MLDQNTDRMWYVIGAVIIGAAIILILNGTMPQIFASVADTFTGKTDEVTEIIDSQGDLLNDTEWTVGVIQNNGSVTNVGYPARPYHKYTKEFIAVDAPQVTLELKSEWNNHLDINRESHGRIVMYNAEKQVIGYKDMIRMYKPGELKIPLVNGTKYVKVLLLNPDEEIRFALWAR